ncbi:hypothetical protein V8C34DRAFT_317185 [Trichoderma compactum]
MLMVGQPIKGCSITGASRGVGEHITRKLAAAGVSRIALVGRDLECINKAKKNFQEAFPRTIASVFKEFGAPDIVINDTGHFPDEGPLIKEELKTKPKRKSATVISLSTIGIYMRFLLPGLSGYATSKMGQARVFELLRFEHPEDRFINVYPGSVETDGYAKTGLPAPPNGMPDGKLTDWRVDELKAKKEQILIDDLLLTTIDGLVKVF